MFFTIVGFGIMRIKDVPVKFVKVCEKSVVMLTDMCACYHVLFSIC